MVKTNMVILDSKSWVQIEGQVYYVGTAFQSITVKAGTLIYPFMTVNTGAPKNALECLTGCTTDPWRPCVFDNKNQNLISYGNTLRYNDPINTSFAGLGVPSITMPADKHLNLKFMAVDKDNYTVAEGLSFDISPAPAGRTQNTCDPYWARYRLNTNPTGANGYVDNVWKGTTPFEVCMPIGIRSLRFSKSGYIDDTLSVQVTSADANADEIWVVPTRTLEVKPVVNCQEGATQCKPGTTAKQQCQNNQWVTTNEKDIMCGYIGNAPCRELTVEITRIDPLSVTPGSTAGVWIKVHNPSTAPSGQCKVNIKCTAGDTTWAGTSIDVPPITALGYSPELRGAYTATQNAKGTVTLCATIDTFFGI